MNHTYALYFAANYLNLRPVLAISSGYSVDVFGYTIFFVDPMGAQTYRFFRDLTLEKATYSWRQEKQGDVACNPATGKD